MYVTNVSYIFNSCAIFPLINQCVVAWLSEGLCVTGGLVHATQICHCVNINQPLLHLCCLGGVEQWSDMNPTGTHQVSCKFIKYYKKTQRLPKKTLKYHKYKKN